MKIDSLDISAIPAPFLFVIHHLIYKKNSLFQPSVALKFINPQPYSGLFEVKLPIFQGDTMSQVKTRLMKTDRSKMKGLS